MQSEQTMRVEKDKFHHVTALGGPMINGINTTHVELVGIIEAESIGLACKQVCIGFCTL